MGFNWALTVKLGFPGGSAGKESTCNAGDPGLIPGLGRSLGEGKAIHCKILGFPGGSDGKELAWNAGDLGSIPGLGRSPGGRHGNPLQYSCLENPMDKGAWQAIVHGVAESRHNWGDWTHTVGNGWWGIGEIKEWQHVWEALLLKEKESNLEGNLESIKGFYVVFFLYRWWKITTTVG